MTRAPSTSDTDEQLQLEPHSEASNHSGDSPADGEMTQSLPAGSHEASLGSSKSIDPTSMNEGPPDISQTLLPPRFFSLSRYTSNQYTDEWIDELDPFGGHMVRAAIENAPPDVWALGIQARLHFIGRTYLMEESYLSQGSGNPKITSLTPSGRVRRAARQRAKKVRGGS